MTDDIIIDLAEYQREEHERLLRWREVLLNQERMERTPDGLPNVSRHLTKLDAILINDPLTSPTTRLEVVARAAYVSALMYEEEPEPLIKNILLLSIRRHHRQFMKLPKRYTDALAPIWATWLDVLEAEEREWKELADA